jgi:hypothetical protein
MMGQSGPEYNPLGFKYISDEISDREQGLISEKADEFLSEAVEKFDLWLKEEGLENAMGMIIKLEVTP